MAHLYIDNRDDVLLAAGLLSAGAVVAHGFGNFYALTARGDSASVRKVNELKGRLPDQVGSITLPASLITSVVDWDNLPPTLTREQVTEVIDALLDLGPFGFRGPARAGLSELLTSRDGRTLTTQVISPGLACPANRFLELAAARRSPLYVTSANLSRHRTGADDAPAHWRVAGLRADFAHVPDLVVLEHRDEAAARAAYPQHLPMSTTILAFHRAARDGLRPALVLERHGSLSAEIVRRVLDRFGLGLVIGPKAVTRLEPRNYGALVGDRT